MSTSDQNAPVIDETVVTTRLQGPVLVVTVDNPPVNALSVHVRAGLVRAMAQADADAAVRAVLIVGAGKTFIAGADIREFGKTPLEPYLPDVCNRIEACNKLVVAAVHGAALGGGMGLASACDICVAGEGAVFATSEVRFGIIPSAISPYVIRAIGARQASRYFQTAERISAARARELGLAHEVVASDALDANVAEIVTALLQGGPRSQGAAKALIRAVADQPVSDALVEDTACRIATLRATPEAREGLSAFLDKRQAAWMVSAPAPNPTTGH